MADFASLVLGVDTRGLKKGERALNDTTRAGKRTEQATDGATGGMGRLGAASGGVATKGMRALTIAATAAVGALVGIGAGIRVIREFETSVARMGAISGATTAELEAMRDVAKDLGSSTEFSAGQAADGLTFLAMAGFDASEAMASIPAVLDLATAAGLGLAEAADTASNIMSGFGIEAADAADVTDILAAASSRANTSVSQLGQAMSTVAPIAKALDISLADTAAAIGLMSDAGIQGERAGTALRGVLASLAGPTSQAEDALRGLGLTIADVDPATNSLTEIMGKLGAAGLSTADAMEIFGREAASGALVLVEGAARLGEFGDELRNVDGAASDMAAQIRDNLGGDIDGLLSSVQGLVIALGDAGLTAILRGVVQAITAVSRGVTALVDGFSRAKETALAFFGISQEANNLESAMDATEMAIDNSTIAMGDQITQSALLATRLSSGNVMTVESARVNLESARARLEDVAAMQSQNEAMARQELGADSVLIDIANAQSALTDARNRLTGEEIQYMDEFGEAFNTDQVSLVRDLESGLIDLLGQQTSINAALSEMDFLSDEQVAAQEQSQANIKSIEAALVDAENGMISFNGEVVSGVSLSDRLAASAGDINFSSAVAGAQALAERLSISLHAAMQMMGLLGAASQAAQPVIFDPRDPRFDAAAAESAARSERLTKIMADLADESTGVKINITGASSAVDGISSGGGGGASQAARDAQAEKNALDAEGKRILLGLMTPMDEYNKAIEQAGRLLDAEVLTQIEYNKHIAQLGVEMQNQQPFIADFKNSILDAAMGGENAFDALRDSIIRAGLEYALFGTGQFAPQGGGGGGLLGGLVSSLFSFDGGGSTGSGPRSGGMDGKGGFPAMLHPNETVIDHTKGQSAAPVYNINVSGARGNTEIREMVAQGIQQAESGLTASAVSQSKASFRNSKAGWSP